MTNKELLRWQNKEQTVLEMLFVLNDQRVFSLLKFLFYFFREEANNKEMPS